MPMFLVIDDDPVVRAYISALLEAYGHSTILARDGLEGVAIFKSNKMDLVITDIVMPRQEGIETIREIRRLDLSVPILAISGSHTAGRYGGYLDLAKTLGATATLAKPFTPNQLFAIIDSLLGATPAAAA